MSEITTLSAAWIAPVCSPTIRDGIVSFVGDRLNYVGLPDGRPIDAHFGSSIILPGLVNAHTHLDLTGAAGKTPPRLSFIDWLKSVIEFRKTRPDVSNDLQHGAELCLQSGTTLIGDIAGTPLSIQAIPNSPLRRVAFFELLGLNPERGEQAFTAWRAAGFIPAGPHAPYSFHKSGLDKVIQHAPLLSIHLAESREEQKLLEHHTGPFVEFLKSLGVWYPDGLANSWNDILKRLDACPSLVVHGNYLEPSTPFPKNATLVYCPRTHAAFGHPPHPFRQFLERGIRVVFGTDSLASNPDLSVLNEARFVAKQHPDFDLTTLLHMITDWSASALLRGDRCGSLAVDKNADLCIVELPRNHDPLSALFHYESPIRAVYVGGVRVV